MRKRFILYILLLFTSTVFAQHYSPYAAWEQTAVEEPQAHTDSFVVVVNPNIYIHGCLLIRLLINIPTYQVMLTVLGTH